MMRYFLLNCLSDLIATIGAKSTEKPPDFFYQHQG